MKLLYLSIIVGMCCKINSELPLFKMYPNLENSIPYISFCDLPTPVIKLENFGTAIKCKNIYMKRDDLTGKNIQNRFHLYGGNKPRKLEFLLADALQRGATTIITYG